MNFSKFAQEMYFYLLVASLYLIRSKLNSLLHSFISCPNEWFQVKLFWRKYNEKLHFRIQFLLAIFLRCWNPVECIQKKKKIPFLLFRLMKWIMEWDIKIQNLPLAGVLQERFFKKFAKLTKNTCVGVSFIIRFQVNFGKNFMSNFSYRTVTDGCF